MLSQLYANLNVMLQYVNLLDTPQTEIGLRVVSVSKCLKLNSQFFFFFFFFFSNIAFSVNILERTCIESAKYINYEYRFS